MRKTNKKGFTLIELLAVIVILAIIIVMAVASVGAVLNRMKKNAYVVEANTIVKAVKTYLVSNPEELPTSSNPTSIIYISDLDLQGGNKSPYGEEYSEESYVEVEKGTNIGEYTYSIYLVDEEGNGIGTEEEPINIDNVTIANVENNVEVEPTYVTDGMLVWLDGINNLGTGDENHSSNTTTWTDLSEHNNSPTFKTGGTLAWNSNNFSFNGGAQTVFNFPTTLNSFELAGNWTVEIRLSRSTNSTLDVIFGNNNNYNAFGIFHRAGSNTYELFNYAPERYYSSNATVTAGVATTIAVTYTPGTIKFYQNGELKNTVSATLLSPVDPATPQGLGSYGNWYDSVYSFGGNIYSFRIYNKVLSEDEIESNYNIDISRFS